MKIKKVSELINEDNGFLVKLRCDNEFNKNDYEKIRETLSSNITEWKKNDSVPVEDVVAIMSLVAQLAGGSRFFDKETAIKVENACIEIQDIITDLIC